MKNKSLYILCLIFSAITVRSQVGEEIRSYVDSAEIVVSNGRKLLLETLLKEDYAKSKEIYQYLSDETKGKNCTLFYYNEDLYINMLLSDWKQWINLAVDYKKYPNSVCYPKSYRMNRILYDEIVKKNDSITSLIASSDLDIEERSVIGIYLHLLKNGDPDERYYQMLRDFHKTYDKSKFDDFFNNFMPRDFVKGSWCWSLGSTYIFPSGELGKGFTSNPVFSMSMDINIGKVYASLYMNGGALRLKTPFTAITATQTFDFELDEKFQYFEGGLLLGYFIVRDDYFRLAPYIALNGTSLKSDRFESNDDKKEIQIFNAFACGPGIHTEFKLFEFDLRNAYGYGTSGRSYIGLKLEGGYNFITNIRKDEFKGNTAYVRAAVVWGLGDF
jgi:hypothetical protein